MGAVGGGSGVDLRKALANNWLKQLRAGVLSGELATYRSFK